MYLKTLLILSSLTLTFIPSQIEYVEASKMPDVARKTQTRVLTHEEQKRLIQGIVEAKSAYYGVDPQLALTIIEKESGYNRTAKGDENYICPLTGKIAPSHGIVQINECWHPHVTIEQAHDIDFSIDFLLKGISEGRCKQWSTCPL